MPDIILLVIFSNVLWVSIFFYMNVIPTMQKQNVWHNKNMKPRREEFTTSGKLMMFLIKHELQLLTYFL